jgi:hypothetical protein
VLALFPALNYGSDKEIDVDKKELLRAKQYILAGNYRLLDRVVDESIRKDKQIAELVEMLIRFHKGAYKGEFDIDEGEVIELLAKYRKGD